MRVGVDCCCGRSKSESESESNYESNKITQGNRVIMTEVTNAR